MPIERDLRDDGVLTTIYRGEFTLAEYEAALAWSVEELEKARSEGRMLGMLSIGAPDTRMDSQQRSYASSWLKENAELLRAACVGQAVVVANPIQRGVLTAILWLGDYTIPIRAYRTEREAQRWLLSHLETNAAIRAHR
jgi:hypothetical protein